METAIFRIAFACFVFVILAGALWTLQLENRKLKSLIGLPSGIGVPAPKLADLRAGQLFRWNPAQQEWILEPFKSGEDWEDTLAGRLREEKSYERLKVKLKPGEEITDLVAPRIAELNRTLELLDRWRETALAEIERLRIGSAELDPAALEMRAEQIDALYGYIERLANIAERIGQLISGIGGIVNLDATPERPGE